jgi:hypothetical protein
MGTTMVRGYETEAVALGALLEAPMISADWAMNPLREHEGVKAKGHLHARRTDADTPIQRIFTIFGLANDP